MLSNSFFVGGPGEELCERDDEYEGTREVGVEAAERLQSEA